MVERSGVIPGRWGDLAPPGASGVELLRFAGRASNISHRWNAPEWATLRRMRQFSHIGKVD